MIRSVIQLLIPAAVLGAWAAAAAHGQANFTQSFDNVGAVSGNGTANLISQGWIFRNQSAPVGLTGWHAGYTDWFPPHAGSGYLAVESSSTDYFGGDVSQWLLLPPVPNQAADDVLTFYVRRFDSSNTDTLQVRYSPTGGTSTGSGPTGVGNFTTLLVDLNPIPLTGWTQVSVALPGAGRIAIRYYADNACNWACFSSYIGIDTLSVSQVTPPGPPLPAPGQTVHWTTAISPVAFSSDAAILAGGTVIVDPGVQVRIEGIAVLYALGTLRFSPGSSLDVSSTANLHVEGLAEFLGSADSPIVLTGGRGGAFAKGIELAPGGRARLDYVTSDLAVYAHPDTMVYGQDTNAIVIDHSTFTGDGDIRAGNGHLAIRNTTISGPAVRAQESYLLLNAVTLDGSVLESTRRKAGQPIYINNVTAQNVAAEAPFLLSGYDHFFGPDNTITNNLYPVHLVGGGIAPGSTLPTTGNTNNYVHGGIGEFVGRVTFARADVPYRLDFDSSAPANEGELTIEPGTTLKLGPGAYIHSYVGGTVIAEGLPDAPITFERLDPAQPWRSISFRNSRRPKMEHCIATGADWAFGADETIVRLESCVMENNHFGASAYSFGQIVARKCRFINNYRGVRTSPGVSGIGAGHIDLEGSSNPNAFAGNVAALEIESPYNFEYALNNWWNDPSGPTHSTNPGGTGESVIGFAVVVPFRDTPPIADLPPIVRLHEHYFLLEEGRKVILHFDASDDAAIAGFRVLYSPHSENPGLEVLLDNIPAGARSIEVVVPHAEASSNNAPSVLRVLAIDTAGQEGWDEIMFDTPNEDFMGRVVPDPLPGPYRPGEHTTVCYDVQPGSSGGVDAVLFVDGDHQAFSLGGAHTGVNCLSGTITIPPVSTDTARIGLRYGSGAGGRDGWEFTDYFSIRPDAIIGDAPPVVEVQSPAPGQSFRGGSVVPIAWTASDDEALRSFEIQSSYDGGRTWHTTVASLAAETRAFSWRLPASSGIPDVRIRVVARDLRFQSSSDTTALSITPGNGCAADFTGDNAATVPDIFAFLALWFAGDAAADFDGANGIAVPDIFAFLSAWFAGCP